MNLRHNNEGKPTFTTGYTIKLIPVLCLSLLIMWEIHFAGTERSIIRRLAEISPGSQAKSAHSFHINITNKKWIYKAR